MNHVTTSGVTTRTPPMSRVRITRVTRWNRDGFAFLGVSGFLAAGFGRVGAAISNTHYTM